MLFWCREGVPTSRPKAGDFKSPASSKFRHLGPYSYLCRATVQVVYHSSITALSLICHTLTLFDSFTEA